MVKLRKTSGAAKEAAANSASSIQFTLPSALTIETVEATCIQFRALAQKNEPCLILQAADRRLTLHFPGVDFVDSAALGMLLLARDEAERYRKPLVLSGASGQVRKMFDMARFGSLFLME